MEVIEACWGMQCLSSFLISFIKKERWKWALGMRAKEGLRQKVVIHAAPKHNPHVLCGILLCSKVSWLRTPSPSRCKTWLISRSWNLYSLSKAFDWDCWAFRDLATPEISFFPAEYEEGIILYCAACYGNTFIPLCMDSTVKTVAMMNEAHDLYLTTLSWKFRCNTLKLRNYV